MNIPKPKGTSGGEGSTPFLKVPNLGRKGRGKLTLLGEARSSKGTFGEQLIVAVKLGKKRYDWAFGMNSGNHTRLFKRFGSNPKKWKGPIAVEVKDFNGNDYIAVTD